MSADILFMKAGNLHRVCEITRVDGSSLLAEPYAIFTSSRNRLEYLCFQVSEPQGWMELEARTVASVKLRDSGFTTRQDYSPLDLNRYPLMHYSIPTHDGRQRWGEKRAPRGKFLSAEPGTLRRRPGSRLTASRRPAPCRSARTRASPAI